ncbi:MAG: type II toxin-antitoxin system Phd/YefM family antitoxin [Egibacteraceae bacterium]
MTTVSTSEYRANLRQWHDRVRRGEEIIVTDNGEPIVRVIAAEADALLDRLEREGLLRRAGRRRPSSAIVSAAAPGDSTSSVSAGRDR